MKIAVFPEGPIAFDGEHYRYSKGERAYLDNLAQYFSEVIIFSFVYKPGDSGYDVCAHSVFTAKNIRVVELPFFPDKKLGVFRKAWHFFEVFCALWKNIRHVDLLYLFLPSYPSAMARLIGKFKKIPHIVYAADDWEQASPGMFKWDRLRNTIFYKLYYKLNRYMEKSIGRSAIFSVTAGDALFQKYQSFGKPVEKTIPRMTLTKDNFYLREDTCQDRQIKIITVGGLIFDKAQHVMLEAIKYLRQDYGNIYLQIIGDGPRLRELQKLSCDYGISDIVEFVGYIEKEEELYRYYKQADIFVLSSVSEGFPRVLYEAMAHSLPIVTTDCGGIPYLIKDGHNGCVVPVLDPVKLYKALKLVIDDDEFRRNVLCMEQKTIKQLWNTMDYKQIPRLLKQHGNIDEN
ncbi:MAG: glycosyltransferase [Gammaproteobacteria bacterium]|jgi:glycosyltransferase involved in cell wall biosynthesis